ncbi:MAG: hypothetical protein QOI55_2651 [Actinomycetota bacterium]|nr:hypothetical protein [Actinomycetota bacterium]
MNTSDVVRRFWASHLGVDATASGVVIRSVPDGDTLSVVRLGDTTLVIAPSDVAERLAELDDDALLDLDALCAIAGPRARPRGVAHLAYADGATIRRIEDERVVALEPADPRLAALEAACAEEEWLEAGMDETLLHRFGFDLDGHLVTCAGYQVWDATIAQLDVITHPAHRRHGYARRTASTAAAAAIDEGLIAQWRSRTSNTASTALGEQLGFVRLGTQATVRFDP